MYHNGASETAIREALVKRHPRENFVLASKFPTFAMPEESAIDGIFAEQLEKCGVDYFDYYLLHNLNRVLYDTEVKDAKLFEHMKKWKEEGKIKHIAFSYHDDAENLDRILTERPEVKKEYMKTWKYQCDNFEALDDNEYGVPVSGIIRAYNSLIIQPDPYFGAELNYYKSFRSGYDRSYETGEYKKQTEAIDGAFDVDEAIREAIEFETKNSFQTYVAD